MVVSTRKTYDQDFVIWLDENIRLLKAKNYDAVDWDNLIEEVERLTRSDKRELENRLMTLFEHALKRRYIPLSDCYRGWEVMLTRTQKQLRRVLKDSPSLRNYLISIIEDSYQEALEDVRGEYQDSFPDYLPFTKEVDQLLSEKFWQEL